MSARIADIKIQVKTIIPALLLLLRYCGALNLDIGRGLIRDIESLPSGHSIISTMMPK